MCNLSCIPVTGTRQEVTGDECTQIAGIMPFIVIFFRHVQCAEKKVPYWDVSVRDVLSATIYIALRVQVSSRMINLIITLTSRRMFIK